MFTGKCIVVGQAYVVARFAANAIGWALPNAVGLTVGGGRTAHDGAPTDVGCGGS